MAERAGLPREPRQSWPPALICCGRAAGLYVLELSSYQLETTHSLTLAAALCSMLRLITWTVIGSAGLSAPSAHSIAAAGVINLTTRSSRRCPARSADLTFSLQGDRTRI